MFAIAGASDVDDEDELKGQLLEEEEDYRFDVPQEEESAKQQSSYFDLMEVRQKNLKDNVVLEQATVGALCVTNIKTWSPTVFYTKLKSP